LELEIVFLIVSLFLVVFDFYQLLSSERKRKLELGLYGAAFGFGLILVSYVLFIRGFVSNDFSIAEVYNYSSSSLSLVSKICASWAGAGGSILFLTLVIAAVYFGFRFKMGNNPSKFSIASSQVLGVFVVFFIIMNIGKNPFLRLVTVPLDGAGLNPALQTPWMMIHPPIVFAGYAFIPLAFALTLGGMRIGDLSESRLLKVSTGIAWLLMTFGIAVGGLWAYEVLGWGGYWSWDPVETGSLLVWLALTAYFFARPLSIAEKSLARQSAMLATFGALIFLSALTRGGLLQSIHAYALSPAGPILIGLGLAFTFYFFYLKKSTGIPLFKFSLKKQSIRSISLIVCLLSLAALFVVSLFGIIVPMADHLFTQNPWTPNTGFYNNWSFPFAASLILGLAGFSFADRFNTKKFGAVAVATIIAGFVLAVLGWPTPDILANIGIPLLLLALVFVGFDLVQSVAKKQRTLKMIGRNLLFLGMIVGMFGILFSAAAKQTISGSTLQLNSEGIATDKILNVNLDLRNWGVYSCSGQVYSSQMGVIVPEHSALKTDLTIQSGGSTQSGSLWVFLYTNYGPVTKPLVLHTLQGDIYVHLDITDAVYSSLSQSLVGIGTIPSQVSLTISVVPMIYLLWIGVVMMCVGIGVQVIDEGRKQTNQS
jgi:cytochrome c biogenesis factor